MITDEPFFVCTADVPKVGSVFISFILSIGKVISL